MSMFNESNSLIEHLIYIGGTIVPPALVLDVSLERSIDSVTSYGVLTFKDTLGLYSSLPIDRDTSIQLYLTDHHSMNFSNSEYKIMEIKEIRSVKDGATVVSLYFVDKLFYNASQTYTSKGFLESTVKDIATGLFEDIDIGLYETDFSEYDTHVYPVMTTPKHKNVLQVLKRLANNRGLYLFRTKLKLQMKHITELTSEEPDELLKFRETSSLMDIQRIISKDTKTSTLIDNLVSLPETKSFKYDIETKTVIPEDVKKEEVYSDYALESKIDYIKLLDSDDGAPVEDKERFMYNILADENRTKHEYGNLLLDNVGLEMMINGTFAVDAGSIIEVKILDQKIENRNEEYKPLTGKYLVHTCIDKIVTGHFVQKLILIRADEKE